MTIWKDWITAPACMLLLLSAAVRAQGPAASAAQLAGGVEVTAERLEYRGDEKLMVGIGSAVVTMGDDRLTADYIQVQTETMDAMARGNVILEKEGSRWAGEKLLYNLKSGEGDYGHFRGRRGPFYIEAEESKLTEEGDYEFTGLTVTTCDPDDKEAWMWAKKGFLLDDRYIKAHHAVFHLGPVPVFYLPWYKRSLKRGEHDLDILPGYSSEWGPFLRAAYSLYFGESTRATTHADYFGDRGLGLGENIFWHDPETYDWHGKFKTYYIEDDEPLKNDQEREAYGETVDSERYRLRLQHTQAFTPRDTLRIDMHYLSDPKILDDFFETEYKERSQPENRISLTHRGEHYSAGALINARLNDFYENVDRKPELTLDIFSLPVGQTALYYESENSFSILERLYSQSTSFPNRVSLDDIPDDYSATRLDSFHRLYYPRKYFRFLNVIPSVSYRGTYYSDSFSETTRTEVSTVADTNGVVSLTTNTVTETVDEGSVMRNVFEFTLENSFKAFKVIHENPTVWGRGLRHVVEPYAIYAFRPEPNVTPDELYQFDEIDRINDRHTIRPGLRNKLQTKRSDRIRDLIDFDLYTTYNLDAEDDEDEFGPLVAKADFLPTDDLMFELEADYDMEESELTDFDAIATYRTDDDSRFSLDYSYRKDRKNQIISSLRLFPDQKFSLGAYARYELDESRMEETYLYFTHGWDCVGFEAGVKMRPGYDDKDDETQIWVKLYLLAFPGSYLQMVDIEAQ